MKKSKTGDSVRFYTQAEAFVDEGPVGEDGTPERLIRLRFKTLNVIGEKRSPGTTPWVFFWLPTLEHFAAQLAVLAEEARRWQLGTGPAGVGSNMGMVAVSVPHENP